MACAKEVSMATTILCRANDCIFWENRFCTSEEITYDPDQGCLTYEVIDDLIDLEDDEDDDWENDDLFFEEDEDDDDDDDEELALWSDDELLASDHLDEDRW